LVHPKPLQLLQWSFSIFFCIFLCWLQENSCFVFLSYLGHFSSCAHVQTKSHHGKEKTAECGHGISHVSLIPFNICIGREHHTTKKRR
jgi:hypothetical protein